MVSFGGVVVVAVLLVVRGELMVIVGVAAVDVGVAVVGVVGDGISSCLV